MHDEFPTSTSLPVGVGGDLNLQRVAKKKGENQQNHSVYPGGKQKPHRNNPAHSSAVRWNTIVFFRLAYAWFSLRTMALRNSCREVKALRVFPIRDALFGSCSLTLAGRAVRSSM